MAEEAAAYAYRPLLHEDEIRILILQPGSYGDALHASLEHTRLDEHPHYEAISYCWGATTRSRQVVCEGRPLPCTESLFTALQRMQLPDRPRRLWADAICINQNDVAERGHQLVLMKSVYSHAARVLIWLGEDKAGIAGMKEYLDECRRLLASVGALGNGDGPPGVLPSDLSVSSMPAIAAYNWRPVLAFASRPWFHRKWVIQEVALGRESVILYGDESVAWTSFATVILAMWEANVNSLDLREGCGSLSGPWMTAGELSQPALTVGGILFNVRAIVTAARRGGSLTMLEAISSTKGFNCTDPRDHLFAIMGLVADKELGRRAPTLGYAANVGELFTEFAIDQIVDGGNIDLLSLASGDWPLLESGSSHHFMLPSWVPNLAEGSQHYPLGMPEYPEAFRAGGVLKPQVGLSRCRKRLHCPGLIVDVVQTTMPYIREISLPDPPAPLGRHFRTTTTIVLQELLRERQWLRASFEMAGVGEPGDEMSAGRREALLDIIFPTGRDESFAVLLDKMTSAVDRLLAPDSDYDLDDESAVACLWDLIRFGVVCGTSMTSGLYSSRFAVMKSAKLGWLPICAEEGDVVCVLAGAKLPFALRPTAGGAYRLLGVCYIHGMMQGQALEMAGFGTEDIVLE